jgi:WhiB family redox-sensing transcriptional regulator
VRHIARAVYGVATPTSDDDWKARGTCRSYGWPDLWFPEGKDKRRQEQTAVDICRQCPMLAMCRESALRNKEIYGVWAAMTEVELRALVGKRGVR